MNERMLPHGSVNSLGQSGAEVREGFREAAAWFAGISRRASPSLDRSALGVWSVRDLIGHTSRAVTTVEAYLTADTSPVEVPTAAAYFLKGLQADHVEIDQRGQQAGLALGESPGQAVQEAVERVTRLVDSQADDAQVQPPVGRMALIEYLPTRTFELTVHTCDLVRALGLTDHVPAVAAAAALRLGTELAAARNATVPLLMAITGREPLPEGYSIVQPL